MIGAELITQERRRQINSEGYSYEHDDKHNNGELAYVASCYAGRFIHSQSPLPPAWPWESQHWKPSDNPIRNLIKAGALIAAEIDRLQRRS